MRFMLDTSICIDYLRGNQRVMEWLMGMPASSCVVSMVAVAELEVGQFLIGNPKVARSKLATFLRKCRPLDYDRAAAMESGRIVAGLGIKNSPTGYRDAMIAGHAVSRKLTVVTRNPADFFKVPGVKVFFFS